MIFTCKIDLHKLVSIFKLDPTTDFKLSHSQLRCFHCVTFFFWLQNQAKGISVRLWSLMRPILVFKNQDKVLLRCFSSLGIVTLCGIRLHVRDFPDTKASLVYLRSFLKCLSSRTDRELTLISTISLFTPPPIAHCRRSAPPLHESSSDCITSNCTLGFIL